MFKCKETKNQVKWFNKAYLTILCEENQPLRGRIVNVTDVVFSKQDGISLYHLNSVPLITSPKGELAQA